MKRIILTVLAMAVAVHSRAQEVQVFFGNLHSHTSYSDGSGKPADAYKYARDTAKVDFLAITEHNHDGAERGIKAGDPRKDGILIAKNHSLYNGTKSSSSISAAKAFNKDGKFVAIYGQEFNTIEEGGNHMNVFEVSEVIDEAVVPNGGFEQLVKWLTTNLDSEMKPAIIQFNHPSSEIRKRGIEYGANLFGSPSEWVKQIGRHACLIEMLNGPGTINAPNLKPEVFESDYLYYLNLGFKLGPTGDQDNHFKNWGNSTTARTGVIAEAKTKANILDALRHRHVYATTDNNLKIIFRVEGHLCGDVITTLPAAGAELKVTYSIVDGDEPDAGYKIEAYSAIVGSGPAKAVESVKVSGNNPPSQPGTLEGVPYLGPNQYVFFKISQLDEDKHTDTAWTAPVWFEKAGTVPPVNSGTTTDELLFVASRNSGIFHISTECAAAKAIKPGNRVIGPAAKTGRVMHEGCPIKAHD